jgi:hypothetical protein
MVLAVWFVGPVAVIVVAFLIYLPTLGMWWYRRERKHRARKLTKPQ